VHELITRVRLGTPGGVVGGRGGGGAGPTRGGGAAAGDGRGQGSAADAVPREEEEPAVREDHPLRVAQGLRRDAAADQGPLRQAHGQRRRGRRARRVVLHARLRIQRRAHLLMMMMIPSRSVCRPCATGKKFSRPARRVADMILLTAGSHRAGPCTDGSIV
jgi:hypothetical protein